MIRTIVSAMSTVLVRLGMVAALVMLSSVMVSGAAHAHSALAAATPADGSTQSEVTSISLTFTEEIVPEYTSLTVTTADGTSVALDAPTMDVTNMVVSAIFTDGMLVDGGYSVNYYIVSIDGHPIEGSVSFAVVGSPVAVTTPSASVSASAVEQTTAPQPTDTETPFAIELQARDGKAADAGLSWVWIGTGIASVVVLVAVSTVLLVAIRRRRNEPS